jgi:hypothetical protein
MPFPDTKGVSGNQIIVEQKEVKRKKLNEVVRVAAT